MIPTVVGYGGYRSYGYLFYLNLTIYSDKPYSTLKPAQPLDRDYFSQANREKPDGKRFLQNYGRFEPVYR